MSDEIAKELNGIAMALGGVGLSAPIGTELGTGLHKIADAIEQQGGWDMDATNALDRIAAALEEVAAAIRGEK